MGAYFDYVFPTEEKLTADQVASLNACEEEQLRTSNMAMPRTSLPTPTTNFLKTKTIG